MSITAAGCKLEGERPPLPVRVGWSYSVIPLCLFLTDRDVGSVALSCEQHAFWKEHAPFRRALQGPHVREWSEGQVGLNLRPAVGFRHRDRVVVDALFRLQCAP